MLDIDIHRIPAAGYRGCFVACVDGFSGLPEALETVFPQAQVQLCIVHKVRQALPYVVWKERRAVAQDLRAIYGAAMLSEAEQALERLAAMWDAPYPTISAAWRRAWSRLTVFFDIRQKSRKPSIPPMPLNHSIFHCVKC